MMQKEVLWVLYTFTNHCFNLCFFKRLSFLRFSSVAFSMLATMFPLSEGKIGPTRKICWREQIFLCWAAVLDSYRGKIRIAFTCSDSLSNRLA